MNTLPLSRGIVLALLLVVPLLLVVAVSPGRAAEPPACIRSGWPSQNSDLQPDPAMVRGTLANGMRYVVMANHEPKDRVAVYLDVQAGSLFETDKQRGLAHFLEHMMFNGSTHFPPDRLVRFFQSIGMSFGGDTNAFTSYGQTVFKLILPDGSREHLHDGFQVMADFARGASLLPREIDKERGVILAEKRSRDSAGYRAMVARTQFSLAGTLLPRRLVIGKTEVVKKADRALLKQYYDAWYRPDNMVLVVVGDVDAKRAVGMIRKTFSPLAASPHTGTCPDFGRLPDTGTRFFYHHEGDLGNTEVTISSHWNTAPRKDSMAVEKEDLYRYAGILILQHRLDRIEEKRGAVTSDSNYGAGRLLRRIGYATIKADTEAGDWRHGLQIIDGVLRSALRYGFLQGELERVKKELLAQLDAAVLTAKSRDSSRLARNIIREFNDDRVFQSPTQERGEYGPVVEKMTLDEVNSVLRDDWGHGNRVVSVVGDLRLPKEEAPQRIHAVYSAAAKLAVAQPKAASDHHFPYLKVPAAAKSDIVSRTTYDSIGVTRLVLKNHVVVSLKPTSFEHQRIRVSIDIGKGAVDEPQPGMATLAGAVVNDSGTGTLTRTALADALSGSTVDVDFQVAGDSLRFSGASVTDDARLLLQLLYAKIVDPGIREEAYVQAMKDYRQMYDAMTHDIGGMARLTVDRFLAGGDSRVGLPSWREVARVKIADLRHWLLPAFAHGSMAISVVGDFDPHKLVPLIERYFGSLPSREQVQPVSSSLSFPSGRHLEVKVASAVKKSLVVVAWPTADFWEIGRTRRLSILADIMAERLRETLREKQGVTYSPEVYSLPGRVHTDYGLLVARVVVAPAEAKAVEKEIIALGDRLGKGGISEDDLDRVKVPLLTSLKDLVQSNGYWMNSVLVDSVRHPQQLEWPTSIRRDYAAITDKEVQKLAHRYLRNKRVATAIVRPE